MRGYLLVLESPQGACNWMANNENHVFRIIFLCFNSA